MRTKQGLEAARAQGKVLWRPKGSKNKNRVLDNYRASVLELLRKGVNLANVCKLINSELNQPISYNSYKYFVLQDLELTQAWRAQRK